MIVDGALPSYAKESAKNPLTNLRKCEQQKHKEFKKYADRAHSVTVEEFAPFAVTAVGSVGEEADATLRALAVFAIPGPTKDPSTRLRRAMWLSARRKELMNVFVRTFLYVVTTKHRLIVSAFAKERGVHGPEELLNPHALPEDVDVLGSIDEDGNDLITASGDDYYNGH